MNLYQQAPLFSPLPEHALLWERVQLAFEHQRTPQALLLVGPRYVKVTSFANRLAAVLLCSAENKPCGLCDSCHLFLVGTHPDFKKIYPETDGSVIKIDQVRALQDDVYHTPKCGESQVILIDPADKMNAASANALLKILEEPPPYVYFILVAEQLSTLPATILSRCQHMVFPDIWLDSSNYFMLGEQYPADSSRAKLVAKRQSIIESLCDIVEEKTSPCMVASQWKDYDLVDLIWLLYLISAQVIQMQLLDIWPLSPETYALTRLARLLNPVDLLNHFDTLNATLKKLNHNISINATLALENILIGYFRKNHG